MLPKITDWKEAVQLIGHWQFRRSHCLPSSHSPANLYSWPCKFPVLAYLASFPLNTTIEPVSTTLGWWISHPIHLLNFLRNSLFHFFLNLLPISIILCPTVIDHDTSPLKLFFTEITLEKVHKRFTKVAVSFLMCHPELNTVLQLGSQQSFINIHHDFLVHHVFVYVARNLYPVFKTTFVINAYIQKCKF